MTDRRDLGPDPDDAAWNRPEAPAPDWQQPPPPPSYPPGYPPPGAPGPVTGNWTGPSSAPPHQPPQPGYPSRPPAYPISAPRPTNTLAIVALICSLVFSPAGVVVGILARRQIRQRQEGGGGLALAAIIIGALGTVLYFFFCLGSLSTGTY